MPEIQRVVACLDLARTQLLRRAAGAAIVGAEARTPGPDAAVTAVAVVGAKARTPRPAAAVAAVAVVGAGSWKPGPAAAIAPIVVAGATGRHPSPSIIRSSAAAIVVAGAAAVAIVTAVTAAAAAAAAAARRRPAGAVHAYRAVGGGTSSGRSARVLLPADDESCKVAMQLPVGGGEMGGGGKDICGRSTACAAVLHERTSGSPRASAAATRCAPAPPPYRVDGGRPFTCHLRCFPPLN